MRFQPRRIPCGICYTMGQKPVTIMLSIAYATDENYVKITAVSMASLLAHNPGAKVTVLTKDVAPASRAFLRALCERLGGTFAEIDVSAELARLESCGANGYLSYATYARLFIPDLMSDARVIYLDSDTLVVGDLAPLSTLDMGGKPLALAYDCQRVEYKDMIGLPRTAPYYNAGVMLIDRTRLARRQRDRAHARGRQGRARALALRGPGPHRPHRRARRRRRPAAARLQLPPTLRDVPLAARRPEGHGDSTVRMVFGRSLRRRAPASGRLPFRGPHARPPLASRIEASRPRAVPAVRRIGRRPRSRRADTAAHGRIPNPVPRLEDPP